MSRRPCRRSGSDPARSRRRRTSSRSRRLLFAVPTLILITSEGATWLTVSLWFVLSCTDGVDGWIARRDGTTRSGAFLDPLADKVLTIGGFVALLIRGDIWWLPGRAHRRT